jgi:hypothetical protein
MSAALRTPANGRYLPPLSDALGEYSTPTFTAINARSLPLLSHDQNGLECAKAWERVQREPSFRPISVSMDLVTRTEGISDKCPLMRNRSLPSEAGDLIGSSRKQIILALPLTTAPAVEQKPMSEPCNRSFDAKKASHLERRVDLEIRDEKK